MENCRTTEDLHPWTVELHGTREEGKELKEKDLEKEKEKDCTKVKVTKDSKRVKENDSFHERVQRKR